MDKSEKISWFEQFKIACLKPSQYKRLLNLAKGKVILFLAAITLITTILGYGMDVAGFTVSVGGWKNFILNRLPAFELKDGTLSVDQEMDFEIGGVHFVADTSKDKVSTEDLSNKYQMELVFAKNEMVVKNTAVGNMMNTFSFKNMKNVEFNNQAMLSMVPMIRIFIVIMFFTQWIANIISYLTVCIFITMLTYFNQRTRMDRKNREDVSLERSLSCPFMPELYLSWWKRLVLLPVLRYLQEWRGCLFLILEVINFYSQDLCVRKTVRNQTKCCKTIGIDLKMCTKRKASDICPRLL